MNPCKSRGDHTVGGSWVRGVVFFFDPVTGGGMNRPVFSVAPVQCSTGGDGGASYSVFSGEGTNTRRWVDSSMIHLHVQIWGCLGGYILSFTHPPFRAVLWQI